MRIEAFQANVVFGDAKANAARAVEKILHSSADLLVFPEAFLTGYAVSSREEALRIAISTVDPVWTSIQNACDSKSTAAIIGFAGRDGDRLFNGAALVRPHQALALYKKTHLPWLGFDQFAEVGDELEVFEIGDVRVGILICYDLRPPEATRVLAIKGADVLVLPTNWPVGAETSAEHLSIARAIENRIYVVTCNRTGSEGGFDFIGRSKIIDPAGKVLATTSQDFEHEEVISASIDPEQSRKKRLVLIPGRYEIDVMGCRQPDLYRELGTS